MSEVVFQFTPNEVSTADVHPADGVSQDSLSSIGSNSYKIAISDDREIIVSFGDTIRYSTCEVDTDLDELLEEAESAIQEYLKTPLRHFDLEIIFATPPKDVPVKYYSDIEEIAQKKSLGEFTSTELSTGSTAITFTNHQNGLVV